MNRTHAFNYRGLSASTGIATEAAVQSDLLSIAELIRKRHTGLTEFALVGRSLGTAFAIWLAQRALPSRLVLLSPFESLPLTLAHRRWMRMFGSVLPHRLDCRESAARLHMRTLVALAARDDRVAHRTSIDLARRIPGLVGIEVVPDTNHQSLPRSAQCQALLARFLAAPS